MLAGDSRFDIAAAKEFGIPAVGVLFGAAVLLVILLLCCFLP